MTTSRQYQVCLKDAAGNNTFLLVEKRKPGEYAVVGAAGLPSLDGQVLSFELDAPDMENLDRSSDSLFCFGRSEHFKLHGPEMEFQDNTFRVANLEHLQAALSRVRGGFIASDEF